MRRLRVGPVEEFGPEHRRLEQPAQQQLLDVGDVVGRDLAEPERIERRPGRDQVDDLPEALQIDRVLGEAARAQHAQRQG